jgi:protein gp37
MFEIIERNLHHTYQMLTKRTERLFECLPGQLQWSRISGSIWMGTSIGSQKSIHRARELAHASVFYPFKVKFLSLEPLWDEVDLSIPAFLSPYYKSDSIAEWASWVIIGGESGNEKGKYRYRECKLEWIEKIVEQCHASKTPVFVKQLGTYLAKKMGLKDRHGTDPSEWPEHLRIQQFPT